MTARRVLLAGLARDADIAELLNGLAQLHPGNDTFPARCSSALPWTRWSGAGASRAGVPVRQACQDLDEH